MPTSESEFDDMNSPDTALKIHNRFLGTQQTEAHSTRARAQTFALSFSDESRLSFFSRFIDRRARSRRVTRSKTRFSGITKIYRSLTKTAHASCCPPSTSRRLWNITRHKNQQAHPHFPRDWVEQSSTCNVLSRIVLLISPFSYKVILGKKSKKINPPFTDSSAIESGKNPPRTVGRSLAVSR